MKRQILILSGILFSMVAFGQFEGTILWSFKMDISDPKMKAQMANAQKEMASPENQAKMAQMEAQMNDPQFKAMMEKNPEMKAMIEKQLAMAKSGSGGNMMDNMAPKGMEVKIKGMNSLTKVNGGMMESEVLYLASTSKSYNINRSNKTYTISGAESNGKNVDQKVTKTDEFITVLGYKCRKYVVEGNEHGQKTVYFVWATTDIKDIDMKQFSKIRMNGKSSSFMEKIDGVPLKMQMEMAGKGSMNMEVTSVKKESLSSTLFEIPAGFTEKK